MKKADVFLNVPFLDLCLIIISHNPLSVCTPSAHARQLEFTLLFYHLRVPLYYPWLFFFSSGLCFSGEPSLFDCLVSGDYESQLVQWSTLPALFND